MDSEKQSGMGPTLPTFAQNAKVGHPRFYELQQSGKKDSTNSKHRAIVPPRIRTRNTTKGEDK